MSPTYPADPKRLVEIRRFVSEQIEGWRLPKSTSQDVVLAVSEVCANVLMHTDSKRIQLGLRITDDRIEVEVTDSGIFHPGVDIAGGRGLALVTAIMDEVSIKAGTQEEPGTVVRLTKYVG
jgi:serine/threonine-protein kinase RsbW